MSKPDVLERIRARAVQGREACRGRVGDESLAECWTAILNAANDLDPPLHGAITRSAIDMSRAETGCVPVAVRARRGWVQPSIFDQAFEERP